MEKQKKIWILKGIAFVLSIILAIIFAKSSLLKALLNASKKSAWIGSFVAGIFVASGFTAAPAIVVLAEIAQKGSVYQTAIIGGLGALLGDLLIFIFFKKKFTKSITNTLEHTKHFSKMVKSKFFRPILAMLGAICIATPISDEIGIALMGLSNMKTGHFLLIVFTLHTIGISFAAFIAHTM